MYVCTVCNVLLVGNDYEVSSAKNFSLLVFMQKVYFWLPPLTAVYRSVFL